MIPNSVRSLPIRVSGGEWRSQQTLPMFLADMANQEGEVEISPSSRYYKESELIESA
jgi:hypothetical protein